MEEKKKNALVTICKKFAKYKHPYPTIKKHVASPEFLLKGGYVKPMQKLLLRFPKKTYSDLAEKAQENLRRKGVHCILFPSGDIGHLANDEKLGFMRDVVNKIHIDLNLREPKSGRRSPNKKEKDWNPVLSSSFIYEEKETKKEREVMTKHVLIWAIGREIEQLRAKPSLSKDEQDALQVGEKLFEELCSDNAKKKKKGAKASVINHITPDTNGNYLVDFSKLEPRFNKKKEIDKLNWDSFKFMTPLYKPYSVKPKRKTPEDATQGDEDEQAESSSNQNTRKKAKANDRGEKQQQEQRSVSPTPYQEMDTLDFEEEEEEEEIETGAPIVRRELVSNQKEKEKSGGKTTTERPVAQNKQTQQQQQKNKHQRIGSSPPQRRQMIFQAEDSSNQNWRKMAKTNRGEKQKQPKSTSPTPNQEMNRLEYDPVQDEDEIEIGALTARREQNEKEKSGTTERPVASQPSRNTQTQQQQQKKQPQRIDSKTSATVPPLPPSPKKSSNAIVPTVCNVPPPERRTKWEKEQIRLEKVHNCEVTFG